MSQIIRNSKTQKRVDKFSKIIIEDKINLRSSLLLLFLDNISPFCSEDMKIILPFWEFKREQERSCHYMGVVETLSITLWKVTKS